MSSLLPPPRRYTRIIAAVLCAPLLIGLGLLTLSPSRIESRMPVLVDRMLDAAHRIGWEWLSFTRLEIIANVVVFIPIGVLAFLLVPRRWWILAVAAAPALSLGIEATQYLALPHRAATVGDVVANSSGGALGVFLAVIVTAIFARRSAFPPLPTPTVGAS